MGTLANQRRFGGGPNRLQIGKQLERAKKKLAAGWLIQDVALEHGYTCASSFSYAFLSLTGERPGEYAARTRKGPRVVRPQQPREKPAKKTWVRA